MNEAMKMLLIVSNIAISDDITKILQDSGSPCFTQWPRLMGRGKTTGPKMDNDVWPGANTAYMLVLPESQARALMQKIQALRDEVGSHEGVKAFLMNVEDMTGDF